jgi:hypothetical protein
VLSISEQHANGLRRVQYVVQNGDHPLNRFGVERIVLDLPFANLPESARPNGIALHLG